MIKLSENKKVQLEAEYIKIIIDIIRKYEINSEIRLIGSRAQGTARKNSDIDIVIMTDSPLSINMMGNLRDDFSLSDIPYKVDLVDWSRSEKHFQEIISKNYLVLD